MKTTKKVKLYQDIERHGTALIEYFHLPQVDKITLCKQLFRLENKMHRAAEGYCNGVMDEKELEKVEKAVLRRINDILGTTEGIKINLDPRGYALKIEEPTEFYYRDWGGYGIIAPDFREGV